MRALHRHSLATSGLALAVLTVVFFWPAVFQGKVIAPLDILDTLLRPWADVDSEVQVHNAFTYDAISQYVPYDYSVYESLRQDGYIGWNPYTHSGHSIMANTMICTGDWRHQLYRFFSFWTGWNLGIILQFFIAGFGVLVLLRGRGITGLPALAGAVAFAFYSQFIFWICHRWVLGAMCWAPWILWALLRGREKGRIFDPLSILFIALAFRGGHLQAIAFVVVMVLVVALADWWRSGRPLAPPALLSLFGVYAVSGIGAALLSLDVLIHTVPAYLEGGKDMVGRPWSATLMALPTLVTSVLPTSLGTPQGLDANKFFGIGLFDIKYLGGIALILALAACCRRDAPVLARVLFVVGILVPFTPLDQWLYSRFTVVFGLGGAWLLAWQLQDMAARPPSRLWKRLGLCLILGVGFWLIASIGLKSAEEQVAAKLAEVVETHLPENKDAREAWMHRRASAFQESLYVWHPRNLSYLALLGIGLFACSRIHRDGRFTMLGMAMVVAVTFADLRLLGGTWITYSPRPEGPAPYAKPAWAADLKAETADGRIVLYHRSDFDYLQLNTPSVYGIRFSEGYETVTPRRIDIRPADDWDAAAYAEHGISHLLAPPDDAPDSLEGWDKVIDTDRLVLFRNTAFEGLILAHDSSGNPTPVTPLESTTNRKTLELPPGTTTVELKETYSPGWRFRAGQGTWQPVAQSERFTQWIELGDHPSDTPLQIDLRFRPPGQPLHFALMIPTLLSLPLVSLWRKRRRRRFRAERG